LDKIKAHLDNAAHRRSLAIWRARQKVVAAESDPEEETAQMSADERAERALRNLVRSVCPQSRANLIVVPMRARDVCLAAVALEIKHVGKNTIPLWAIPYHLVWKSKSGKYHFNAGNV